MAITRSKITAQGQISIPREIRRAGRYSSEDVHRALFDIPPEPRTLEELKEGARRYVNSRHARR